MARHCIICEIKLSFFYRKSICEHCQETKYNYYLIGDNILKLVELDDNQLTKLAQFGHSDCLYLYESLFQRYLENHRLTKERIKFLRKISSIFSVNDKTIRYERENDLEEEEIKAKKELQEVISKIRNEIKNNNKLPEINKEHFEQLKFPLSKNEEYFISGHTAFHEIEIISNYQSGGERFTERGKKLKSTGNFILTSNTFHYIPFREGRSLKIDLSKIIKYYSEGGWLSIRKDGRGKAYWFKMNSMLVPVCIIGLDFLFEKRNI